MRGTLGVESNGIVRCRNHDLVHALRRSFTVFYTLAFFIEVPDARNGRPRLLRCGDAAVCPVDVPRLRLRTGGWPVRIRRRRGCRPPSSNGGVAGASIGLSTSPRRASDPPDAPRGLFCARRRTLPRRRARRLIFPRNFSTKEKEKERCPDLRDGRANENARLASRANGNAGR